MNISPISPVGSTQTAQLSYGQFLADERVNALNRLRIQNADNAAKDFLAGQNARIDSRRQYQNSVQASDLSMLQFLQNGSSLETIMTNQGGSTAVASTVAPAPTSGNPFSSFGPVM